MVPSECQHMVNARLTLVLRARILQEYSRAINLLVRSSFRFVVGQGYRQSVLPRAHQHLARKQKCLPLPIWDMSVNLSCPWYPHV